MQETGEGCAPTFNLDQLEECDSAPEDSCSLTRLDCTTHTVSHQVYYLNYEAVHMQLFNIFSILLIELQTK